MPEQDRPHPAAHGAGVIGLAVGALGVVFGDIGTSPLYAVQTVFAIDTTRSKHRRATCTASSR